MKQPLARKVPDLVFPVKESGEAAAGEQRCCSPARALQIYPMPAPRANTRDSSSPEIVAP